MSLHDLIPPDPEVQHMLRVIARYRQRTARTWVPRSAVRLHPRKMPDALRSCLICDSSDIYAQTVHTPGPVENPKFVCMRCGFPFYFSDREGR